jgi:hypothetical protein
MKPFLAMILIVQLFLVGCKTAEPQASLFRQPSWWERRMRRFEDWERRHGYPVTKTRNAILTTAVVTGTAIAVVAACVYEGSRSTDPHQPVWYP